MNYGQRLEELVEESSLTRKEIAEKMGITPGNLSQLVGRTHLKTDVIEKACKALNIDTIDFYIPKDKLAEYLKLTPETLQVAQLLDALPPDKKNKLLKHILSGMTLLKD